jgi:Zn-dependent protease
MKTSFRICDIIGIEVRVHITLFIILVILSYLLYFNPYPMGFMNLGFPNSTKVLLSILASISLFVAVLLHELSHSILSRRSGVNVKGIVLFIFGGVSLLEEIPKEPGKEISIAFAGPLTSLSIAATSFGIYFLGIPIISEFFRVFGNFNLILAIFNLIPAFPLDGGRILRGVMARKTNFVEATRMAAETGKMFAIFMGVVGLFTNPWLILIALFIYMGASEEERLAVVENVLRSVEIREVMSSNPVTVSPSTTVEDVIELMFKFKHLGYPVIEDGELVGMVTLNDVTKAPREVRVEDVMSKKVVAINPKSSAFEAFKIMNENKIGRLPVVEDGKLVGIVSRTDLVRVLELVEAISSGSRR